MRTASDPSSRDEGADRAPYHDRDHAPANSWQSGTNRASQGEDVSYEDYCIEKQFAKATQGMSQQEAADYENGVIREAIARGLDPRTVLTERGFPC